MRIISFNTDAARLTSDEEQQLFLESIQNEVILEAMDNWNEEDPPDADADYTEVETFADNRSSLDQVNANKCPYCDYSSARKYNLKQHIKTQHTHKDHKPFTCANCSYATKQKSHLTKHEKTCKF